MTIVAGVDFGTLSVRVTLVDSKKGPIGTASASYPLHRRREDPISPPSPMRPDDRAGRATRDALESTGVDGNASPPSRSTPPAPA
jgi:L-ribulokinase